MFMEELILAHVQQQLANADAWVASTTTDINGRNLLSRYLMVKAQQYVDDFMGAKGTKRWLVMPGLRGVGKTTLLGQQYKYVRDKYGDQVNLLHLSMHDVVKIVGSDLNQAMKQYETLLGFSVEHLTKPTFLFLDEVQEDPKWADVLFSLHERSRRLFIYCSGSSAIYLKQDANLVRRAHMEPLYPLNYTEYQMLRFKITPEIGLKKLLKKAVFESKDATEALQELRKLVPAVRKYLSKVDTSNFTHFMYTGSLPFLVNETNPAQVYNGIMYLIDRIISEDLTKGYNFDGNTLDAVKPLLFHLADGDVMSREKLAKNLRMFTKDERVIGKLLDALVRTELLIEVPARGSVTVATSKPRKYLFMSPAIRAALQQIAGSVATQETRKGRLLEDLIGLYMHREFVTKRSARFTYNAGQGHSDFTLLTADGRCIPIEVGLGEKTAGQVVATMKEVNCSYGVVISATPLSIDKTNNVLFLPLSIFYVM